MKRLGSMLCFLIAFNASCRTADLGLSDKPKEQVSEARSFPSSGFWDPAKIGLDLRIFWQMFSSTVSREAIKLFYDQPNVLENIGLDLHTNQFILADDGVKLQISYYLPKNYTASALYPAVILINPWGSSSNANQLSRLPQNLAQQGYIVLLLTARGFGLSGGQAAFANERDAKDVTTAIDWLLANTATDVRNIGICGISYGGGVSLASIVRDQRLKTAVGLNVWVDFTEGGFYSDGGINYRAGKFLVDFGKLMQCRFDDGIQLQQDILIPSKKASIIEWARERSVVNYLADLNRRQVPLLFLHTYNDSFFKTRAIIDFMQKYQGPSKLSMYLGVHGTNMMFEGFANQGLGAEAIEWFNYWLKSDRSQDPHLNRVGFAIRNQKATSGSLASRQHAFYTLSELAQMPTDRYLLSAIGESLVLKNATNPPQGSRKLKTAKAPSLFHQDEDTRLILEGLLGLPVTQDLSQLSPETTAVYLSDPALNETMIRGESILDLSLISASSNPQLTAYLFDQPEEGPASLITQGSLQINKSAEAFSVDARVRLTPVAYDLKANHKLALVIDTKDWDFYAPTDQNNDVTIVHDALRPSQLTVPKLP